MPPEPDLPKPGLETEADQDPSPEIETGAELALQSATPDQLLDVASSESADGPTSSDRNTRLGWFKHPEGVQAIATAVATVIAFCVAVFGVYTWWIGHQEDADRQIPNPETISVVSAPVATKSPLAKPPCVPEPSPGSLEAGPGICVVLRGPQEDYGQSVTVSPISDPVRVQLQVVNSGKLVLNDIVVRTALPAGWALVPTTSVAATGSNPEGFPISDGVAASGVNLGSYAPGGLFFMKFTIRPVGPDAFSCGVSQGVVRVTAETDYGTRHGDVVVTVDKKC